MRDMMPRLGIIVVNYASSSLLLDNLTTLTLDVKETSVVVVDNFSTGVERVKVEQLCLAQQWDLVTTTANVGFGIGINLGVNRARELMCSIFLLLNPDVLITTEGVAELRGLVANDPLVLVSPRILRPDGSVWFDGGTVLVGRGTTSTRDDCNSEAAYGWLTGACLAVHIELWTRLAGFDDDYFLYWEDVDLSWRCIESGGRLMVAHGTVVSHNVGGTQVGEGKSPAYVYYNCRNRLKFAVRHLSARDRRRWCRGSVGYARVVLLRGGRRALFRNFFPLAAAAARGTLAGLFIAAR